jgi:predicted acylesterase/phospholipase RssA
MNGDEPAGRRYEALAEREYLERAANELKRSVLFEHFSRRLLFDMVERNGVSILDAVRGPLRDLDETSGGAPNSGPERVFLAIVVLEGTAVAVQHPHAATASARDGTPLPPNAGTRLPPGVYIRDDTAFVDIVPGRLRITTRDTATVVAIDAQSLADCPAAAWSVDQTALSAPFQNIPALQGARRPEIIWVAAAAGNDVPIEAAMHILGAAIARQPGDPPNASAVPLALCILGAQTRRLIWSEGRFETSEFGTDPFVLVDRNGNRIEHVQFVAGHPQDPMHWPPNFTDKRADRVVHLTTELPTVLPDEMRGVLWSSLASGDESIYTSYVASVLLGDREKPTQLGDLCGGQFDAEALPSGATGDPAMRPYRDSCTLRADNAQIRRAWENWSRGDPELLPPFIDIVAGSGAMSADTSARWARAVCNRRVGVAISGGGASAYRAGPLLCRIEHAGIPIDVFAGLSGGALLGAFYCGMDPGGFNFFKWLGPLIQATMPGVVVWTWPFEVTVDALLDWTRVEDLERRFAAIAVALPDATVPETKVVVKGTLGEAVRASGCLPPSFAPTTKNWVRYTDGGAGCLVPASAARHCGADVVLACNVIPGPSLGNPLSYFGRAAALLRWTPWIGRLVDNYTWYAYLMQQSSKAFGGYADAFVEFSPQPLPLLESVCFIGAQQIIDDAERDGPKLDDAVAKLKREWLNLQPPPPVPPPPPPPRPAPRARPRHK